MTFSLSERPPATLPTLLEDRGIRGSFYRTYGAYGARIPRISVTLSVLLVAVATMTGRLCAGIERAHRGLHF
eukprot:23820-Eustigmatos_ZCMA.PRE.1